MSCAEIQDASGYQAGTLLELWLPLIACMTDSPTGAGMQSTEPRTRLPHWVAGRHAF